MSLKGMLQIQQRVNPGSYNEVIVSAYEVRLPHQTLAPIVSLHTDAACVHSHALPQWEKSLPDTIEAFVVAGNGGNIAQHHRNFLNEYGLSAAQVPLVSYGGFGCIRCT